MQYEIKAQPAASVVDIRMSAGESITAEVGAMISMTIGMTVETTSRTKGGKGGIYTGRGGVYQGRGVLKKRRAKRKRAKGKLTDFFRRRGGTATSINELLRKGTNSGGRRGVLDKYGRANVKC